MVTETSSLVKPTWLQRSRSGFAQGGPRTLAALRIATGIGALLFVRGSRGFELPPESLWFPPPGTAWLSFLPATQTLYDIAIVVVAGSAAAVVVGWRPQWSASVCVAGIFYVGWVTTLTGKVNHSHHLMWVLLILAVSPSANALSVRRESRQGSFQWPVVAVMGLIGLIYLGAGIQKLTSAGLAWGWSDNLMNTMLNMAWEKNQGVHQWLLDWPLVGRFLGIGALLFEIAFLPLVLFPATRRWVWPLGLAFHWGIRIVLGISFLTLELMYVVFLPLDRPSERTESAEPTMLQRWVIASLIAAVTVFSVIGLERAWPVAAYPGFRGVQQPMIVDVELVSDGSRSFVTRSPQAEEVGRERILPLVWSAMAHNREAELADWLGADSLTRVVIDTRTGTIIERTPLDAST